MCHRVDLLRFFGEEARKQHLHFVVIKGMALSSLLYGDAFARQSGDIDILVASDDVPEADYVARSCGWLRPGEAHLVRPLRDANTIVRGAMGFKTCYDLHVRIERLRSLGLLEKAGTRAAELGVENELAHVLEDVCEVFPDDVRSACFVLPPKQSLWLAPYTMRMRDAHMRARNGVFRLTVALSRWCSEEGCRSYCLGQWKGGRLLSALNRPFSAPISFCAFADKDEKGFSANKLPKGVASRAWCQQGACEELSVRAEIPLAMVMAVGEGADFTPESLFVFPSVWERVHGQLYRRFAGVDFADMAEEAIRYYIEEQKSRG